MKVHIEEDDLAEARKISLMDYLSRNRPAMYSSIKRVGSQYIVQAKYFGTKGQYSSFMIRASTGDWWWHSKNLHGRNALDYLIKAEGYDFQTAVLELLETTAEEYKDRNRKYSRPRREPPKEVVPPQLKEEPKVLQIPEADKDTRIIRKYLEGRGIDPEIIDYFISNGSVYQDAVHKSVCFVGYDRDGIPKLINQRGTYGSFKGNTKGSDRRYSFMIHAEGESSVHFYEAPLDMMSYACLIKRAGYDFRQFNLVSLSGISGTGSGAEIKLPVGVEEYLERFPDTDMVYIHFDNDEPGRTAGECLRAALQDRQIASVLQYPPMGCKDVNDYLVAVREYDAKREAGKQAEAGL